MDTRRPARAQVAGFSGPDPRGAQPANRLHPRSSTVTVTVPGFSSSSPSRSSRCGRSRRGVAGPAAQGPSGRRGGRPAPPPRPNPPISGTSRRARSPTQGSLPVGWSTRRAGTRSATGRDRSGPSTSLTRASRASTRPRPAEVSRRP